MENRQNRVNVIEMIQAGGNVIVNISGTIIAHAGDVIGIPWGWLKEKVVRFVQDKRTKTAVGVVVYAFICSLLIPTECEFLDQFANGSIECTGSPYDTSVGTHCNITCDERYRKKGDNDSVQCLEYGNWTRLPTCELITCPETETIKPQYGSVNCTDGNTADSKCAFTCDEKHQKFGPDEAVCERTGDWSLTEPAKCVLRACDPLQKIEFSDVKCSNVTHKVGTSCRITCTQNHVLFLLGKYHTETDYNVECLENEQWSKRDLPLCVCPWCKTGENCQWTTSWNVVKSNINDYGGQSKLNYAGHEIGTETEQGFHNWKHEWRCRCRDTKTGHSAKCAKKGRFGSCEHACSKLIRDLVSRGIYEKPCDESSMKSGC